MYLELLLYFDWYDRAWSSQPLVPQVEEACLDCAEPGITGKEMEVSLLLVKAGNRSAHSYVGVPVAGRVPARGEPCYLDVIAVLQHWSGF